MEYIRIADVLEHFEELLGSRQELELLTLTEKRGFLAQSAKYNKRVARDDTSDYKVIRKFDVAFNPYLLWAGAIAQNVDWEEGLISPLYPTFHVRNGYDPRYVDYLLRGESLRLRFDAISFGSVPRKRRASVADFLDLAIPKPPPLLEQRHIAEILDRADLLRTKRREALAQLDSLTRAIFLELFGDPVTNPKGWPCKAIGDIGKVITGKTPSRLNPGFFGHSIEWIKSDNISVDSYFVTRAVEWLSEAGRAVLRTVPPQSILVTCIAGSPDCIGKAAMTDREVAFNQQINALVPSLGNPHFLLGQLLVGKRLIQMASTNSMKGLVSKSRFEQVPLLFPPLALQDEFSRQLAKIEGMKALYRRSLAEFDSLFASLQHRAFRGEL